MGEDDVAPRIAEVESPSVQRLGRRVADPELERAVRCAALLSSETQCHLRSFKRSSWTERRVPQFATDAFRIFNVPYLFETRDELIAFQSGAGGTRVKESLLPEGFTVIALFNGPSAQLFRPEPFTNPESFVAGRGVVRVERSNGDMLEISSTVIGSRQYELLSTGAVGSAPVRLPAAFLTGVAQSAEMTWPELVALSMSRARSPPPGLRPTRQALRGLHGGRRGSADRSRRFARLSPARSPPALRLPGSAVCPDSFLVRSTPRYGVTTEPRARDRIPWSFLYPHTCITSLFAAAGSSTR